MGIGKRRSKSLGTLYFTNPTFFKVDEMAVFIGFYARRAAAINLVLTHSVLAIPEDLTAAMISSYSGGETRVEMNLPRFSFLGSVGRPTLGVSAISFFNLKYSANDKSPAMLLP